MTAQKIALVVGGSGGIGGAICKRLIEDGFFVCATYAHSGGKGELHRAEYDGKAVAWYQMDLLQDGAVDRTMGEIRAAHPRIDVVVFCPTLPIPHKSLLDCEWSDFEAHAKVQLKGMVGIVRNLSDQIRAKHRTKFVVLLTEYCIGKPPGGLAPYVVAKYGLMGFAKMMAVELARYNATVNMVSPGMVDTELLKTVPPKLIEMVAMQNPMNRIAKAEDVAEVVAFLSSDGADYLNGVNMTVNGGGVIL